MSIAAAAIGGLIGTFVLTTVLRTASELRLTRMDLPFLVGTIVTMHRGRAKLFGYMLHFCFGLVFAMLYFVAFVALDRDGWVIGLLFGLVHGTFAMTALVNILLPAVHPRMGGPTASVTASPLIEAPGFLMRNYGRSTPLVNLVAHAIYGAIVGLSVSIAR
jgi:hypothetical protein